MLEHQKIPSSFKKLAEKIEKFFLKWFFQQKRWIQLVIAISILIFLLGLARSNFLGEQLYRLSKILIPLDIPWVDPPKPMIPLYFSYEIEDQINRRDGKLGGTCYTGDRIYLNYRTGIACWITLFGVDSKGVHPILQNKFNPIFIEKDKPYSEVFTLDNTSGYEVYYAVAAMDKFDFDKDIRPYIKPLNFQTGAKGPTLSEYQLNLSERFRHEYLYFNHLSH